MSLAYFLLDDFESCVIWSRASLEFDKQNYKGHLRMGNAYVQMKLPEKARIALNELKGFEQESLKNEINGLKKKNFKVGAK